MINNYLCYRKRYYHVYHYFSGTLPTSNIFFGGCYKWITILKWYIVDINEYFYDNMRKKTETFERNIHNLFPVKTLNFPPRTQQLVLQGTHRAGRGEDAAPVWNAPASAAPVQDRGQMTKKCTESWHVNDREWRCWSI